MKQCQLLYLFNMLVQLLVILIFVSSGTAYLDDSRKEAISLSAITDLDESMKQITAQIYYENFLIEEYAINLTVKLVHILNESSFRELQAHFPRCYDQAIQVLMEDIINLLLQPRSIPCFQPLNAFKIKIMVLLENVVDGIGPIENHKSQCIQYPHICGIEPTYKKGLEKLEIFKKELVKLKHWRKIWRVVEECVQETMFQVRRKIYSLHPDSDNCDWVANRNIFLRKFSLLPLSLGKLVDPEEYWTTYKTAMNNITEIEKSIQNDLEEPVISVDLYSSCDIQERLLKLTSRLSVNMKNYSDIIQFRMNEMTDNVINLIPQMVDENPEIKNWDVSQEKDIHCKNPINKIIDQVKKFVVDHLSKQCFHPLPRLAENFQRIQGNLSRIRTHLEQTTGYLSSEDCHNITVQIFDVDTWIKTWKQFDLNDTWNFVSDCYDTAFSILIKNIKNHKPIWEKCRSAPIFEGIFAHLPINLEKYPPYESS